ncbi:MAG: CHAD domain-containing protein [Phycisphaeraceae bacterium]|nr:CHAD domain-containing protein [Phycisphaeraceae bacterium]
MTRSHETWREPAIVALRHVLRRLVRQTEKAGRSWSAGEGDESLHDYRVCMRRLRSVLRAFADDLVEGKPAARKFARRLGRAIRPTNAGRDAEVHVRWLDERLARALPRGVEAGLRRLRDELTEVTVDEDVPSPESVVKRFHKAASRFEHKWLDAPSKAGESPPVDAVQSPTLGQVAAKRLAELRQGLHRRVRMFTSVDQEDEAHQTRLAAKRLRYLLDPLQRIRPIVPGVAAVIQQLRRMQDLLGQLHDLQVLHDRIEKLLEREAAKWGREMLTRKAGIGRAPQSCRELAAAGKYVQRSQQRLFKQYQRQWGETRTSQLGGRVERLEWLMRERGSVREAADDATLSESATIADPTAEGRIADATGSQADSI